MNTVCQCHVNAKEKMIAVNSSFNVLEFQLIHRDKKNFHDSASFIENRTRAEWQAGRNGRGGWAGWASLGGRASWGGRGGRGGRGGGSGRGGGGGRASLAIWAIREKGETEEVEQSVENIARITASGGKRRGKGRGKKKE